jgi:hypothetical protein
MRPFGALAASVSLLLLAACSSSSGDGSSDAAPLPSPTPSTTYCMELGCLAPDSRAAVQRIEDSLADPSMGNAWERACRLYRQDPIGFVRRLAGDWVKVDLIKPKHRIETSLVADSLFAGECL